MKCGINSEKEGHECFETSVMRSFFQNFDSHNYDGITHCYMHDIVHEFALFLTKDECIFIEVDAIEDKYLKSLDEKTHHLSSVVHSSAQFPTMKYNEAAANNVRTLFMMLFSLRMFLQTLTLS